MPTPIHYRRLRKTMQFMIQSIAPPAKVLDLGIENHLSLMMKEAGYNVINTQGEDLDTEYVHLNSYQVDVVTAFEIFEHMFAPYNLLKELQTDNLIATVPLNVWFNSAYWNEADDRDKHYHEFEPRQFDLLLKKTGWQIVHSEIWRLPPGRINGIRPMLRFICPSYYAVHCKRLK
jgi:hypothetical protein